MRRCRNSWSAPDVPGTPDFDKYFILPATGWTVPASWGAWSEGPVSTIMFRAPSKNCSMNFDAMYIRPEKPSRISINDGPAKTHGGGPIELPANGEVAKVVIRHDDPKSPKELGLSEDPRIIAFGLKHIDVTCGTVIAQTK